MRIAARNDADRTWRGCQRTASRPRLAAASNANGRSELFNAPRAVERAASRGRLAVRPCVQSCASAVVFIGGLQRTSARKNLAAEDHVSPTVTWLVNMTLVANGVQFNRPGEADTTTVCPRAAATVRVEIEPTLWGPSSTAR